MANICFKNIKFLLGNYQPIVPRQKHYCEISVQWFGVLDKIEMFPCFSEHLIAHLKKVDNPISEKTNSTAFMVQRPEIIGLFEANFNRSSTTTIRSFALNFHS